MDSMEDVVLLDRPVVPDEPAVETVEARPRLRHTLGRITWRILRALGSAIGWLFGLAALTLGLSLLAALPVAQFLSLGYFLESSARVAQSGRLRDGFIGVRRASRLGVMALGLLLSMAPLWLASSYARSAELIDPGGPVQRTWRVGLAAITAFTFLHLLIACTRGGRLRHFVLPFDTPFWLVRKLRAGGLYREARDGFWAFLASFRIPYYFRLGFIGFLGTLVWLVVPASLMALSGPFPLLGLLGAIVMAFVAPSLPFLQVRYALEGRPAALFSRRFIRERFRHAPWAFAFALMVLLLASVPLYLLKIEMIPREAAWLPGLLFVVFLAPAHLLVGWAYSRSRRRSRPRHWIFRGLGRLAIIPVALFYVLVVFLAQYTSWGGIWSLYEQHAFLLPVPFLNMN
jgi:hypothetical protein